MKVRIPGSNKKSDSGDFQDIAHKVKEMQKEMEIKLEELSRKEYYAVSGGGTVNVTVNGSSRIVSLKIDPKALSSSDTEIIEDMIIAAVNEALRNVDDEKEKISRNLSSGLPAGLI
ncbi:MAG: YbaB/EbfC family nucleoid-associated protein [Oscillospiraceae bacterium]|jgi:DNA-binding YbaB/EbfC family protein|nr:YbaB/EbfC family nucleoid-associated protein [Oscillospiraceae bacterium]